MSILFTILIYVVVFCLVYYPITILPIPAPLAWLRTVFDHCAYPGSNLCAAGLGWSSRLE